MQKRSIVGKDFCAYGIWSVELRKESWERDGGGIYHKDVAWICAKSP